MIELTEEKRRVAILGANGRLSRMVARAFHARGWKVRAITRSGECEALSSIKEIEFVAADAMNQASLITATSDCDVIFNGLNPVYTDWAAKCMPMAINVIAAAKASGAVHLFPGNVYHFGSTMASTLTPQSTVKPDHRKANIRLSMERFFEESATRDNVQTIIVRAGDFFGGDGTGSWFDLVLISKIANRKFTYPGHRNILHAWAYLPDLAETFVKVADKAETLSKFEHFHFEGHNVSGEDMHQALEAVVGMKLKKAGLPGFIFKIAGLFRPMMREINEVYYLWTTPHSLKGDRLKYVVGSLPHTPLVDAVRNALVEQGQMVSQKVQDNNLKKLVQV